MGNLISDEFVVHHHKTNLASSANEMKSISSVGPGSTNHDVNSTCTNLYENTKTLLQNYSSAAALDIENIKKIDDELHEVDAEMSGEML